MGKELGEVFCKICGKSSNEDKNFHKKQQLCNRHYLQIKRHGEPTGNDRIKIADLKDYCEVCKDKSSIKYYVWNKEGEYKGKTLCNKHYTQMLRHNYLLDNVPSDHKARISWTNDDKNKLEEFYKQGLSFDEISKRMNRSINSINAMSSELKLGEKYTRSNNPNFKAVYQDYDWCYERYINKGMSHQEMADECGASLRVIQKWCSEIHKLNRRTYKNQKRLNNKQKELIMFGLLGDGHIDKRETQPMYIESHAENQKDYLYWKYNILKDICNKEPMYYPPQENIMINGSLSNQKAYYRINTKIVYDLKDIRNMTRIDIINNLNEFGLSIHTLDDGTRTEAYWSICLAEYTQEEINLYIKICKERFGLNLYQCKDIRYANYDADSSRKLDKIILNNIPNNLDIIKYKILENDINKPANYIFIINKNGDKVGLNTYCRNNGLFYKWCKYVMDKFNYSEINEKDFLELVNKEYE